MTYVNISKLTLSIGKLAWIQSLLTGGTVFPNPQKPTQQVRLTPDNAYLSCSDASYIATSNAKNIDPDIDAGTTTRQKCKHAIA